jgi:hypothetical protein
MHEEADAFSVRILIQMIDPGRVERRRTPFDAVNDIFLVKQKFGEDGAILAGNAGNQSSFCHFAILFPIEKQSKTSTCRGSVNAGNGLPVSACSF